MCLYHLQGMNYTSKQFHLHYISHYTLIVKANYQYDKLYVLDQDHQLLVYMNFESHNPSEEALKLLSLPFQKVYVSIPTHNLTFVPDDLYQEVDLVKYQEFMENPAQEMSQTAVEFLQIQAFYQLDVLLHHRWKTLFPDAKFVPEFKLNLIQARPYIPLKGDVLGVVFDDNTADIYLFINGQFKFYNTFEVVSDDDLSYFILNLFENFGIEKKVNKVLYSGLDVDHSFIQKLKTYSDEVIEISANKPSVSLDEESNQISRSYLIDLPTCE